VTAFRSSVQLTLKKETKGTVVYENVDKGLTGVYVPKNMLPPGEVPKEVTFTISTEE
jgi:hypothetical protein